MSVTDVNRESAQLAALAGRPALARVPTYLRLSGPGWLQGAMTLGGGSAITSLTIGAVYGYKLLWVQPLAMIIGCIMLFSLSHQTLSTGIKPFAAMRRHAPPCASRPGLAMGHRRPCLQHHLGILPLPPERGYA